MNSISTDKNSRSVTLTVRKRGCDAITVISEGNQPMVDMQSLRRKSID